MSKFNLADRYRLELRWEDVDYGIEGMCKFKHAFFSGPALQEALKLNDQDSITLDFYHQYLVLVGNVYVANFLWEGPTYNSDGTISFEKARLTFSVDLSKVPKLNKGDYLIIDTKGHDVKNHPFNLVYKTYVVNEDTNLYKFGGR